MKNSNIILILSIVCFFSACRNNTDKPNGSTPANTPELGSEKRPQDTVSLKKINYPAAVVFEGGSGNPWADKLGLKHSPTWRLYICLKKTEQPVSGQVDFDFIKLGFPFEISFQNSETKELVSTERLNKVLVDYTYTTTPKYSNKSIGNLVFESKSTQDWELVYPALHDSPSLHDPYADDDFFNLQISASLSQYRQKTYESNGLPYYVANWFEEIAVDESGQSNEMIDICEGANQPFVWQFNEEIKKK